MQIPRDVELIEATLKKIKIIEPCFYVKKIYIR